MTSELSYQRNDAITYLTCSCISRHWELFVQFLFTDIALQSNLSVRTPLYYGQFPMSRQNSDTFSLKKASVLTTGYNYYLRLIKHDEGLLKLAQAFT